MTGQQRRWAIVVPVKRLALAKTRLAPLGDLRRDLALAMALDTVAAARSCELVQLVLAVCDDLDARAALQAAGAALAADEPDAGLNPALRHGAAVARRDIGDGPVAALSADLPALRASDLTVVLSQAENVPLAVVADAAGEGTTLLAARSVAALLPAFGAGSRRAHVSAGAVDLTDSAPRRLRADVDTPADLAAARDLGLGAATAAVVARAGVLVREG